MRLIKFRAWNRERKVMGSAMPLDVLLLTAADDPTGPREELQYLEIMQFTGLHDKNGKEIYEGDIMRGNQGKTAVVEWVGGGFSPFGFDTFGDEYGMTEGAEIIGNIYENPELINRAD